MKSFFCSTVFLATHMVFAQVSVNTTNPQGAFHVDGSKDNPATGTPTAVQQANDFVVKPSGSVGVGTVVPDTNAVLDLKSDLKGFLPPRLALTSSALPAPLSAHVAGMVVYNTSTANGLSPGLYLNDGTKWGLLNVVSDTQGTTLTKVKYRGRNLETNGYNKPTLKVPAMNMEFRFAVKGGYNYLEVRLLSAPSADVTYNASMLWFGQSIPNNWNNGNTNTSVTFTPSNWNVWSQGLSYGRWNGTWSYQCQISTTTGVVPGSNDLLVGDFYGINTFGSGAGENNEIYVLAFDLY
ncbi:hypothetical protein ACR1PO_03290 [Chryseobacterium sp. RRHN12]|uniref:hypothetical protein n=1 Tax=Chryseobacterium sp. RRHN12 TaxID=3437884 RepID=UPI003D9B00E9